MRHGEDIDTRDNNTAGCRVLRTSCACELSISQSSDALCSLVTDRGSAPEVVRMTLKSWEAWGSPGREDA